MPIHTTAIGSSYNDHALKDAVAQLTANEAVDDATVAALDALVKAIPKPGEEINIGCTDGNTVNLTTMALVKNQRVFAYSITSQPISLKIRFDTSFGKTLTVIGATGTPDTDPASVTIPNVLSCTIYQDFKSGDTAINRKTYALVTTPSTPSFGAVNSDLGLSTWQASAKPGSYVEDVRDGTIWVARGGGSALRFSQTAATRVIDLKWFDTAFATKYTRKVSRATITSLTLEFKQNIAVATSTKTFSLSDFTTGFVHSGYWNGPDDLNGRTSIITIEPNKEKVIVSWDGAGENLTIGATSSGGTPLQIRKVRVNGVALDYAPIYDPIWTPESQLIGHFNSDANVSYFVAEKPRLRLESITFDMRDRRQSTYPARVKTGITLLAANMGGGGNGWAMRADNTPLRDGAYQVFRLGDADFGALIQWRQAPGGYAFFFQDEHSSQWNTYAWYYNVMANFAP